MEVVCVPLGSRSYDIKIGAAVLDGLGAAIKESLGSVHKVAIISSYNVFALYGNAAMDSLRAAGFHPTNFLLPDGEEHKNMHWAENILSECLRLRLDRSSALVALGGGVIGDITGFAASLYMRGIRFVQVPTTLLAQVDSSVGGKTGVNHPLGKNMIGSFWQPSLVWIDTDTLRSLPRREFCSGMAEVIKYGVIWDSALFEYLDKNAGAIMALEPDALRHIISRSCAIKAEIVSKDEREGGLRAILNYGHTIGHAIENATHYTRYLHGEAVAIGMCAEAALSAPMGIQTDTGRIAALMAKYELPTAIPADISRPEMMDAMAIDKKALKGEIRFVLPEGIGAAKINVPVGRAEIEKVLA